jgi:hypothetical protein
LRTADGFRPLNREGALKVLQKQRLSWLERQDSNLGMLLQSNSLKYRMNYLAFRELWASETFPHELRTTNNTRSPAVRMLLSYMKYFNEARTHLSLNKDAPVPRAVQAAGRIVCRPILGGLHHQYGRI